MAKEDQYRPTFAGMSRSQKLRKVKNKKSSRFWKAACSGLFSWMIPHQDDDGYMRGEIDWIKATIIPHWELSENDIKEMLIELHNQNLIIWYEIDGEYFINMVNSRTGYRKDRYKPTIYPLAPDWQPIDNQMATKSQPKRRVTVVSNQIKSNTNTYTPTWLSKEDWDSFVDHRETIKKPLSEKAKELAIEKLTELRDAGNDPSKVIKQSIFSGWQGLFPLRDDIKKDEGYAADNTDEKARKINEEFRRSQEESTG
ncbi:MAG TPA: hypothetical protein VMZ04_06405 [Anaerolineae bacterium]|nr:hypothetical protein [Anaerolineae bacterium]